MDFTDKKIAIAGYGVEGKSTYDYLKRVGVSDSQITIADQKERSDLPDVATVFGPDSFEKLTDYDVVFRSPSVRPSSIKTNGRVWSLTNEFFAKCKSKNIIGVTGTNGKGTTSALLDEILRTAGKNTHLVGNIGVAALDRLENIAEEDIVIYELSSFQLWDIEFSPRIAIVLMITQDHLDKHSDMQEYVEAKAQITAKQKAQDILIYHGHNGYSRQIADSTLAESQPYLIDPGAHVEQDKIYIDEQLICSIDQIGLSGVHNIENVCAAVTAAWNITNDAEAIQRAVQSFKGLPHRMEYVRTVDGVEYYNDSNSSVAIATQAALDSFTGKKRILVFGGYDKGLDVSSALSSLTQRDHVVLIGQTGSSFMNILRSRGVNFTNLGQEHTMQQIVAKCAEVAEPGSVVLFSPAHPSYDMFDNLYQRGDQFREAVNSLSN